MTWKAKLRFCTQELNAGDRIKHNEWMKWIIWARWVTAGPAVTDQLPDPAALCLWSSVGRHISAVTHSCRWKTDSRSVTPTPLGRTGRLARCVCVFVDFWAPNVPAATERWGECFIPHSYLPELRLRAHSELTWGLNWVGSQRVRCKKISLYVCADIYRVWTDAQEER